MLRLQVKGNVAESQESLGRHGDSLTRIFNEAIVVVFK